MPSRICGLRQIQLLTVADEYLTAEQFCQLHRGYLAARIPIPLQLYLQSWCLTYRPLTVPYTTHHHHFSLLFWQSHQCSHHKPNSLKLTYNIELYTCSGLSECICKDNIYYTIYIKYGYKAPDHRIGIMWKCSRKFKKIYAFVY